MVQRIVNYSLTNRTEHTNATMPNEMEALIKKQLLKAKKHVNSYEKF